MENNTGVVFIHGAGLGTYIWEKVTPYIKNNLDPERIITLKSGHLPMMSIPKELAEELKNFIQTCENDPGKPEQP